MGEVWLGRDTLTDNLAAVKLVASDAPEVARTQFEREWRAIARLDHPNIVHLYEVGPAHLATAYIDGPSLQRRLQSPIDPSVAIDWTLQVASALGHAHAQGVVHRDVKPANVLLDSRGNAFLADFGLALFDEDAEAQRGGTPKYMAPEQWEQSKVGPAADQFALGRTLLAMLIGGPPPTQASEGFALLREDLPAALIAALQRALHHQPDKRFASVSDFAVALAAVDLGGLGAVNRLATTKRDADAFAWAAGCHHKQQVGHDLERTDTRISELVRGGQVDEDAWQEFQAQTSYAEFGWAMYGRPGRLGSLDTAAAVARASEVVVLLHGWGCTRDVWARIAQQLCRDNAEVLVLTPDVQGFGESVFDQPWPSRPHTAPDGFYTAIKHWLALLGLHDLPTVIVGHSMAGIAVLAGEDAPDTRRPYRVSIAPPWLSTRPLMWWWVKIGTLLLIALSYLGPAFRLVTDSVSMGKTSDRIAPHVRTEMIHNMRRIDRTVLGRIAQGIGLGLEPSAEAIHRTIIIAGDEDPMLTADPIFAAAARIGIPRSHVRVLSTASHYPHIEDPEHPEHTARNSAEIVACIDDLLMSCRDPTLMYGGLRRPEPADLHRESADSDTLAYLVDD